MIIDQATKLRELVGQKSGQEVRTEKISIKKAPLSKKKGRIIAVTSGKGGVGKTNFVINLALNLSKLNKKVIVVDLDLGLANIDILLNLTPKYNLEDFIQDRKTMDEILIEGPRGIKILPGGSGIPHLADLTDIERHNFIEGFLSLVKDFDYVLLDTAAGISRNVIDFVLIADDVVVVTTPEPTAITDAYATIKIIGSRSKDVEIHLLFNMVESQRQAKNYFKKVNQVIQQFLKLKVSHLGYILNDACVHLSIMKRKPFTLIYPFSNASRSLGVVTKKLIAIGPRDENQLKHFVKKLQKFFSK